MPVAQAQHGVGGGRGLQAIQSRHRAGRWPGLSAEMRTVASLFLARYEEVAGGELLGDHEDLTAHTGCLLLARTDGKSPAAFLDPQSVAVAREAGLALLRTPELGLWQWS